MKHSRFYSILAFLLVLLLPLFNGCSKDTTYIIIEDDQKEDTVYPGTDSSLIRPSFTCSIMPLKNYKTISNPGEPYAMPKNSFVHLYVYLSHQEPGDYSWFYYGVYYASRNGQLSPLYNHIQLPAGTYTLYAVATNDLREDITPDFDQQTALSAFLYNGEAYYWGRLDSVVLSETDLKPMLSFSMEQCSSRIRFYFENLTSTAKLTSVHLSAPDCTDSRMSLASGLISPAKKYAGELLFTNPADTLLVDLIPFMIYQRPMTLALCVLKNEQTDTLIFDLPWPKNEMYQGGYAYAYRVDLENKQIEIVENESNQDEERRGYET